MMSDDKVTVRTRWCVVVVVMLAVMTEVVSLNGSNMCMLKQKYNITKRVKYRAPMAVRTYEWCFSVPPRCSKWTTEMRDLTKLETEERTADVAVCCPGYKMQEGVCLMICPLGKTGPKCSDECPENKWGPNCANDCKNCEHGICSPVTGECQCKNGWQGERCETITPTTTTVVMEELLTTNKSTPKLTAELPTKPTTSASTTSRPPLTSTSTNPSTTTVSKSTTETLQTKLPIHYTTGKITTMISTSTVIKYENETLTTKASSNVLITTTPTTLYMTSTTKVNVTTSNKLNIRTTAKPISATKIDIEEKAKKYNPIQHQYNRTETPVTVTMDINKELVKVDNESQKTKDVTTVTTRAPEKLTTTPALSIKDSLNQSTKKPEPTVATSSTTKFKPKEIWIKPAQKGESTIVEIKTKQTIETSQHRLRTLVKKEPSTMTTPRTIIVSIIPTSVSYTSFKKIALSTTSYVPVKNQFLSKLFNKSIDLAIDKSSSPPTTITTSTKKMSTPLSTWSKNTSTTNHIKSPTNKSVTNAPPTKEPHLKTTKLLSLRNNTNSMLKVMNAVDKISKLTTVSTIASNMSVFTKELSTLESMTKKPQWSKTKVTLLTETNKTTRRSLLQSTSKSFIDSKTNNPITELPINKITIVKDEKPTNDTKRNVENPNESTIIVTKNPIASEETFNILTEPEHITAVMGEKETARSSADLISVLGIAGGVMMAVITLATVIVMMERCRKPRYEDIRKMNEMRMQVYLDENDVPPPPYVRSIFHTPLPDPPNTEKCHYQPISTLDRNVKQFMRPVVVQTISPIMLENFRGILECHYDHLPLRNSTITQEERITPSIERCRDYNDLRVQSLTDSTIEALKCEARLESIDSTTSEPLYAEIPCWRPPSEHAIEIVNLNGEAMTEL